MNKLNADRYYPEIRAENRVLGEKGIKKEEDSYLVSLLNSIYSLFGTVYAFRFEVNPANYILLNKDSAEKYLKRNTGTNFDSSELMVRALDSLNKIKYQKELKDLQSNIQQSSQRQKWEKDDLLDLKGLAQDLYELALIKEENKNLLGNILVDSPENLKNILESIKKDIAGLEKAKKTEEVSHVDPKLKIEVEEFLENVKERKKAPEKLLQEKEQLLEKLHAKNEKGAIERFFLRRRLEEAVIPGAGSHVRFQQARYNLEHRISIEGKFRDVQGVAAQSKKILNKEIENSVKKDNKLYIVKPLHSTNIEHTRSRYLLYQLIERMGTKPLQLDSFTDEYFSNAFTHLQSIIQTKGVSLAIVPGHALLMSIDPKNGIYRFYDPNFGIFRFKEPESFVTFVCKFIDKNYISSQHHLSDSLTLPQRKGDSLAELGGYLEVSIPQAGLNSSLSLNGGVCVALCSHVGRFLLEHPDFQDPLTPDVLGLSEFDIRKIHEERAKTYMENGEFEKAEQEYRILLGMIPLPEDKRDRQLERIARSGRSLFIDYATTKGYFDEKNPHYHEAILWHRLLQAVELQGKYLSGKKPPPPPPRSSPARTTQVSEQPAEKAVKQFIDFIPISLKL